MEEKHIPIEHLTDHMTKPSEPRVYNQAQEFMNKLREKSDEEIYRSQNLNFEREHPRYRGICANLGNPVFSDTPVDPLAYRRPHITYGLIGYQRPTLHPMYITSSSELGQQPIPSNQALNYYPKDNTFTLSRVPGGNYQDTHFTTELDKESFSG